jgi:hypothetical protein
MSPAMTVAPSHPPVHSYDPGKNPMELVSTSAGRMERWRADALLLGETSAAIQARHDAVTTLDHLEQQKRELAAGQAALAIERATLDAEKRIFADQAAALAGRLSVEWDRFQKIKADQEREPEEPLEILPEEWRSAELEPSLELEDTAPGEPSEAPEKKDQDLSGEFLREVPEFRMPVAAGFDSDKRR